MTFSKSTVDPEQFDTGPVSLLGSLPVTANNFEAGPPEHGNFSSDHNNQLDIRSRKSWSQH